MSNTRVSYGIKYVRNIGNYESVHVDLHVEDSVRDDETVTQAYARIKRFVEKKINENLDEIDSDMEKVGREGGY